MLRALVVPPQSHRRTHCNTSTHKRGRRLAVAHSLAPVNYLAGRGVAETLAGRTGPGWCCGRCRWANATASHSKPRATPSSLFVIADDVEWMGVRFALGCRGACVPIVVGVPDERLPAAAVVSRSPFVIRQHALSASNCMLTYHKRRSWATRALRSWNLAMLDYFRRSCATRGHCDLAI